MDADGQQRWEEFFDPEKTRPTLLVASVYLAAYELLKSAVVDRIRDFYCLGFERAQEEARYRAKVLSRRTHPIYASFDWLIAHRTVTEADVAAFDRVKACRNRIAHELLSVVGGSGTPLDVEARFADLIALLRKIELWWITEVEIPTNPDMDGKEIDREGIVPGSLLMLQLLCDIAFGDEKTSRRPRRPPAGECA